MPPLLQGAAQSVAAVQLASYREREGEMYYVSPSHMRAEHTVKGLAGLINDADVNYARDRGRRGEIFLAARSRLTCVLDVGLEKNDSSFSSCKRFIHRSG